MYSTNTGVSTYDESILSECEIGRAVVGVPRVVDLTALAGRVVSQHPLQLHQVEQQLEVVGVGGRQPRLVLIHSLSSPTSCNRLAAADAFNNMTTITLLL